MFCTDGWMPLDCRGKRRYRTKIHPATWTNDNIAHMKKQLQRMASVTTGSGNIHLRPKYYRWEQLFFIWMYEKGLAYKKRSTLILQQVRYLLANEQVEGGLCWRCARKSPKGAGAMFLNHGLY